MVTPRRIALTGAPGAGKTSLIEELGRRGWRVVPEAARAILQESGGMELRASNPIGFALAMLEADKVAFESAEPSETVIFDRGFCDITAFIRIEGFPLPSEIDRACKELRFEAPTLYAPAWKNIYKQDNERIQSWEEARESGLQCLSAWRAYGYDPISLPLTNVESRADWVEQLLAR